MQHWEIRMIVESTSSRNGVGKIKGAANKKKKCLKKLMTTWPVTKNITDLNAERNDAETGWLSTAYVIHLTVENLMGVEIHSKVLFYI